MPTGDEHTSDEWEWPDDEPLEVPPLDDTFNFFDIDATGVEPTLTDHGAGAGSDWQPAPRRRRPLAALLDWGLLPFVTVANLVGGRARRPVRPGRGRRRGRLGTTLVRLLAALLVAVPAVLVIKLIVGTTSEPGGRTEVAGPPRASRPEGARESERPKARPVPVKRRVPANRPARPAPRKRARPDRPARRTAAGRRAAAERRRARLIARLTADVPDAPPRPVAPPTPSVELPPPAPSPTAEPAPTPPVEPKAEQEPPSPPARPVDAAGTEFGFEG